MLISLSKTIDLKDYTYAQYTGSSKKTFTKGTKSFVLKSGGYFAYRESKTKNYFVFPGLLDVEFGIDHSLTDKLFAKSDKPRLKRTELTKLFKGLLNEPKSKTKEKAIEEPKAAKRAKVEPLPTSKPNTFKPVDDVPSDKDEREGHAAVKIAMNANFFELAQEEKSDDHKLKYLKHAYTVLNNVKFSGKLKIPNLRFLKQISSGKFRQAGHWNPTKREMAFNRRLFLKAELAVLMTLLHEQCHQYVSEVLKGNDRTEGGHGPQWQQAMRDVGLTPNRYNQNMDLLLTDEETAAKEERAAWLKQTLDPKTSNKEREYYVRPNMAVQYLSPYDKNWHYGVTIKQTGKKWSVVLENSVANNYMNVPTEWLHKSDREISQNVYDNALRHVKILENNRQDRANKKFYRSLY
jgi:hypothetical protein